MPCGEAQEVTRETLHARRIEMHGWRRSDGLFEIEGWVVDSKPRDFVPPSGDRAVPAGEAIHDVVVRLTFDKTMEVRAVAITVRATP